MSDSSTPNYPRILGASAATPLGGLRAGLITLREGSRCGNCEPAPLDHDISWLRSIKGDPAGRILLRTALASTGDVVMRLKDEQILQQVIDLIGAGKLHVCRPLSPQPAQQE